MTGFILLFFIAVLCAYLVRFVAARLRWSVPSYSGVIIVVMIAVLAVWGRSL
ncbi:MULTISPECIES: hypothetical protein [Thermomonospora]|uniref:Uncharacterized protein n=1 Tax=Thermomonospora curvata (strain ATCC 19995 / DSM 43183 / JCM 3096 / KCTC 9072 / NBRC 15933 / NCIMB 10081 / Henssen B9) TaxID=471852 RepID=D1A6F5_THECD|nr:MULTISPECIES: hypothetical protein [Thermomonospora]ACY96430.1 hypothetical protein Tcur_0840 [Thermomonospora curvata DSM 43183]